MSKQIPSWREREPSEDTLYEDSSADSSDRLLSEKDWAPTRRTRDSSTRLARWNVGLLALLCVLVVGCWATMQTPLQASVAKKVSSITSGFSGSNKAADKASVTTSLVPAQGSPAGTWTKPTDFKIQGLVFYGRRVHVDILDCYLQQNLVKNGGYLDGVIFLQNTDDVEDVAYLEELLAREPAYTRIDVGADVRHWKHMWDMDFDEDTMYFKIDDDLVYIHPDAIPQMVHTLVAHPEAYNVQANIVNSASTSWQHYHAGAVRPYLPERQRPETSSRHSNTTDSHPEIKASWRASELPAYPSEMAQDEYDFEQTKPFNGHRWLPMEENSAALMKTPIRFTENYAWGRDWTEWSIGAQHHYSLLHNIEEDALDQYQFGNGHGIFNTGYERYKINLMGIWGKTLNMKKVIEDDEREFTEEFPAEFRMPVLVQTRAIAAHFSFEPQRDLYRTDLLSRYRAYANEMVCAASNQKTEFPEWQKTMTKWNVPSQRRRR